jgi:hypothetical protein
LGTDEVDAYSNRHGVIAILKHRLLQQARGRGRSLQYLVQWECDAGDELPNSWEPADYMDACPDLIFDYWSALDDSDSTIPWAKEQLVKEQLVRARKARGVRGVLARCGQSEYALAPGSETVVHAPSADALRQPGLVGFGILVVFSVRMPSGLEQLQWYEGTVTSVPTTRSPKHRVYWPAEGKYSMLVLSPSTYCVDAQGPEGSWFLFSTADKVDAFEQV